MQQTKLGSTFFYTVTIHCRSNGSSKADTVTETILEIDSGGRGGEGVLEEEEAGTR